MDIKLISLTKNDPSEFAGAKKTISDCANAFNSETEKFKNFSSPKRALLAISQALRSADAVIAAVQTSGFNSFKKTLFSALEIKTQQNDEIYAQLLPLCEKGKITKTALINHSTFPVSSEIFATDDFIHCGFCISAGAQSIIVLPLDNIKTAQTVFGSVFDYLSSAAGNENKDELSKFRRCCASQRLVTALKNSGKTLAFAPLGGTRLFKEAAALTDPDCAVIIIGEAPQSRQSSQPIKQYITDVAQKCREESSSDYVLAVSSAFASNADNSVFIIIAVADKDETNLIKLYAKDGEDPKEFSEYAVQKALEEAGSAVYAKEVIASQAKSNKADRALRQKISTVAAFAVGGSAAICAILALILGQ